MPRRPQTMQDDVVDELATITQDPFETMETPRESGAQGQTDSQYGSEARRSGDLRRAMMWPSMYGTIERFSGGPAEDVTEWLDQFKNIAMANQWLPSIICVQLPVYLTGMARAWYNGLPKEVKNNHSTLMEELEKKFKRGEMTLDVLMKIRERKQRKNESVEEYACAMEELFRKSGTGMNELERAQYFIEGLQPQIQTRVLKSEPTTWIGAIEVAKKEERTKKRVEELMKRNKDSSEDQKKEIAELKELVMRIQEQQILTVNEGREPVKSHGFGAPSYRTTDGRPICRRCNRVGHTAPNCFTRMDQRNFGNRSFNNNRRDDNTRGYKRPWRGNREEERREYKKPRVEENYKGFKPRYEKKEVARDTKVQNNKNM